MDLAPTLLWLSGFPLSLEMPGRPWTSCLSPQATFASRSPASIPTYGRRSLLPEKESDFNPAVLERLDRSATSADGTRICLYTPGVLAYIPCLIRN
jgi:hypothetical protein